MVRSLRADAERELTAGESIVRAIQGQGKGRFVFKIYDSDRSLKLSLTLQDLKSHLWEAANILRGSAVDRTDWKAYILPLLFFKRISDVVLANPPYSIKKWNREAWQSDPWGRNFLGTPPQGRADYAFFQHILKSMDTRTGRCAILFPQGVLGRNEEADMRRKLIQMDSLECVLGLGPNLFYNSPMEAFVLICRSVKPAKRQGMVLFIDAVKEVARARAQSFLKPEHQSKILDAYRAFADQPGFSAVVKNEEVLAQGGNLSIPRHVNKAPASKTASDTQSLGLSWAAFEEGGQEFWTDMDALVEMLEGVVAEGAGDA